MTASPWYPLFFACISFAAFARDARADVSRETICLVTHYDAAAREYADFSVDNHTRYAQRWGYGYRAFEGRISGTQFVDASRGDLTDLFGGGLFWQKVMAVERLLTQGAATPTGESVRCAWVMWLDSDALVTDPHRSIEDVMAPYVTQRRDPQVPIDVLLAQEADHPINAGVFFVRNSEGGQSFVQALAALYPLYKTNWLPEQTAIASLAYVMEPWPSNHATQGLTPTVHPGFAIAPQRAFNSFYALNRWLAPQTQWQQGDFIAHFAGTPRHMRLAGMRGLMQSLAR